MGERERERTRERKIVTVKKTNRNRKGKDREKHIILFKPKIIYLKYFSLSLYFIKWG